MICGVSVVSQSVPLDIGLISVVKWRLI